MAFKKTTKPLELVVSSILSLKQKNGCSFQDIIRYLVKKQILESDTAKFQVQTGIKKGISFGLLSQKKGLYSLSNVYYAAKKLQALAHQRKQKEKLKSKALKKIILKKFKWRKKKSRPTKFFRKIMKIKSKKRPKILLFKEGKGNTRDGIKRNKRKRLRSRKLKKVGKAKFSFPVFVYRRKRKRNAKEGLKLGRNVK